VLRIYHKCDEEADKKGYRRVTLRIPQGHVTLGRMARKPYEVGTLNLQVIYPKEDRENKFEEGVLRALLMMYF